MIKCFFTGKLLSHQFKIPSKIPSQLGQVRWTSSLRRSMLYLWGNQANNLQTASLLAADCIVLDCEYQEEEHEKTDFRQSVKEFLDGLDKSRTKSEYCVRVNPVQTPEICEADLKVVLSAKNLPDSICLPKIYNPDQLQWFTERMWNHLIKRPEGSRGPLKLIMLIESARAMLNLTDLCKKAEELATMAPIEPVGLALGGFEVTADLGASKTISGLELLYVREKFVLIAKAFGLQAIDMLFDKRDKNSFKEKCEEGAAIGFTGKQVINPPEAVIAQDVFVPTRAKVLWAKTTLRKYYKSQDNKGELNFENAEVDMATFRRAEHILKVAIAAGKIKSEVEAILKEGA